MLPAVTSRPSKENLTKCLNNVSIGSKSIDDLAYNLLFEGEPPIIPNIIDDAQDETNLIVNLPDLEMHALCKRLPPPDRMRLARTCKTLFKRIFFRYDLWTDVGSLAAFQSMCTLVRSDIDLLVRTKMYLAWPESCLPMFFNHLRRLSHLPLLREIRQDPTKLTPLLCTAEQTHDNTMVWVALNLFGLPPQTLDAFCETVSSAYLDRHLSTDLKNLKALLKQLIVDHPHYDFTEKLPILLILRLNDLNRPAHQGYIGINIDVYGS